MSLQNAAHTSMVKIQTLTASSSASLEFKTGITSNYTSFVLILQNLIPSALSALRLTLSTDGGSTYLSSGYRAGLWGYNINTGGQGNLEANATAYMPLSNVADTVVGLSGTINLHNLMSGSPVFVEGRLVFQRTNPEVWNCLVGGTTTATNVNAFKLAQSTGTIVSGKAILYGII